MEATLINVSGGRSSGYMLRRFLDAHDGLPADAFAVFCNTGLEHESCYEFLHEIERRWCPIVWLEYRYDGAQTFERVDYCSASRQGEPFSALIRYKKMLPNPRTRLCTSELKTRTSNRWVRSLGYDEWTKLVGIRADEPRRAAKMKGDIKAEYIEMPLFDDGVTKQDVADFWAAQDFDLQLPGDDDAFGNCQLCFLKSRAKLEKVIQTNPHSADWWIQQEAEAVADADGRYFRVDRPTYAQMHYQVTVEQRRLVDDAIEDDTLPCMCGD